LKINTPENSNIENDIFNFEEKENHKIKSYMKNSFTKFSGLKSKKNDSLIISPSNKKHALKSPKNNSSANLTADSRNLKNLKKFETKN